MRLRRVIGPVLLIAFLLFVTATYVGYSDKVAALKENGGWYMDFEGKVYLTGGELYTVITELKPYYDSTPEVPSYSDYLGIYLDSPASSYPNLSPNETLVEVHITIRSEPNGLTKQTLLDKTISVPYLWAGGGLDSDGLIATFSYSLGPYIAQSEYSPIKVVAEMELKEMNGIGGSVRTGYLTIPELELEV